MWTGLKVAKGQVKRSVLRGVNVIRHVLLSIMESLRFLMY